MEKIIKFLNNERVKGLIAILAAITMYCTPDHIDLIIETCLAALGISKLTIEEKK